MKLLSIDGIMGAGKSYLFNLLKENFADNKKLGLWTNQWRNLKNIYGTIH